MNVVLASIFRNSSGYLDRYFGQVANLRRKLVQQGHTLRMVWVEGDSTDDTFQKLAAYIDNDLRSTLLQVNHGGKLFASVDDDERWRNISKVCNVLLDQIKEADDFVVYVESDLLWTEDTMLALLDNVHHAGVDACAPMCFHLPTGVFYDTWGHRKDGQRFLPHSPYHSALVPGMKLTQLDSAGSCIVMRAQVAREARFDPPELGIVGFGNTLRKLGFLFWLNSEQRVFHP